MKKRLSALEDASNCLKFIYLTHPQRQEAFSGFHLLLHRRHRANGAKIILRIENKNQGNCRNVKPLVLYLISRVLTSNLASTNNQL